MKKHALFALFLTSNLMAKTYGEFAKSQIKAQLTKIEQNKKIITNKVQPEETKNLRKDIGLFKIQLDLFTLCYKDQTKDEFLTIREYIDEGYESIGEFKDLFDTLNPEDISESKLEKRRNKIIEWNKQFNTVMDNEARQFLANPLTEGSVNKKKDELSKFYWNTIKYRPDCGDEEEIVLNKMVKNLFKATSKFLDKVLKIDDILIEKNEVTFHDFRKQLRGILQIINTYPEFFAIKKDSRLTEFQEVVDAFGDLNDLLVKHHLKPNSEKTILKIKERWPVLKQKLIDQSIKSKIKEISDEL